MAIAETTDTTTILNKAIKKFTTDLAAGSGQDTTSWICPNGVTSVNYLVVAGGGSGGEFNGGGGGSGGLLQGTIAVLPGTSYDIKIGTGGYGVSSPGPGVNGSNSQFFTVITTGGGGGQVLTGTFEAVGKMWVRVKV